MNEEPIMNNLLGLSQNTKFATISPFGKIKRFFDTLEDANKYHGSTSKKDAYPQRIIPFDIKGQQSFNIDSNVTNFDFYTVDGKEFFNVHDAIVYFSQVAADNIHGRYYEF